MKKNIHPKIYTDCTVKCACGNTFVTTSTLASMSVDICSACHPLFTGQQKFIDTEGRIEKFNKKTKQMAEKISTHKALKEAKSTKKQSKSSSSKPTLKEIFQQLREEETQKNKSETGSDSNPQK